MLLIRDSGRRRIHGLKANKGCYSFGIRNGKDFTEQNRPNRCATHCKHNIFAILSSYLSMASCWFDGKGGVWFWPWISLIHRGTTFWPRTVGKKRGQNSRMFYRTCPLIAFFGPNFCTAVFVISVNLNNSNAKSIKKFEIEFLDWKLIFFTKNGFHPNYEGVQRLEARMSWPNEAERRITVQKFYYFDACTHTVRQVPCDVNHILNTLKSRVFFVPNSILTIRSHRN